MHRINLMTAFTIAVEEIETATEMMTDATEEKIDMISQTLYFQAGETQRRCWMALTNVLRIMM